jgi:signal transduction histidine kinase
MGMLALLLHGIMSAIRYVREQREQINIAVFLAELRDFYRDRLAKNKIELTINAKQDLRIRMNRGKLIQVIDNFILNSEYWLKEDIAQNRLTTGIITLELERPFIRVSDNGRGIDPAIEPALFEPFNSAKAKGLGRGLGLFIVKQLLDSEGCSVGVIPERNQHQRLYKFQIDLRGAIND